MGDNPTDRTHSVEQIGRRHYLGLLAATTLAGTAGCVQGGPSAGAVMIEDIRPPTNAPQRTDAEIDYGTEKDRMVEMRDGVELATDVHLPEEDGPFPALVHRTPYEKDSEEPIGGISMAIENGYAVVQQDVRGRFKSEGWFEPFFEGEDGYDTVEWVAEQDWCTGKVGMYGTSYRGMVQIQALQENPPSLAATAPFVTPANFYADVQYMGGANNLASSFAWAVFNSFSQLQRLNISESKRGELREELGRVAGNWPDSAAHLPEIDMPALDEGVAQYWRDWLQHPTFDMFWKSLDILADIDDVEIPMFHAGGWYDIFLKGTTDLFTAIEDRGTNVVRENQRLVLGPWSHGTYFSADPVGERDFGENASFDVTGELLFQWFDRWLKDEGGGISDQPKVQYFQMGENEWRSSDTWPPEEAKPTPLYLDRADGTGRLTEERTRGPPDSDSYEYDPLDPVPTKGGPILVGPLQQEGVVDQRPVEERNDVLVYTSEELSSSVSIAGDVTANLFIESTAPDTDFIVRLVDVEPDGYAMNVTEGALRVRYRNSVEETEFIEPGEVYKLSIDLRPVAHTFRPGHRIRLDVTSSNFPKLDRNPNAAIPVATATEADMQPATQTIHHSPQRRSRVTLPLTGRDPGERGIRENGNNERNNDA